MLARFSPPVVSRRDALYALQDAGIMAHESMDRQARGAAYIATLNRLADQPNRMVTAAQGATVLGEVYAGIASAPSRYNEVVDRKLSGADLVTAVASESIKQRLADEVIKGNVADYRVVRGDILAIDDTVTVVPSLGLNAIASDLVANSLRARQTWSHRCE